MNFTRFFWAFCALLAASTSFMACEDDSDVAPGEGEARVTFAMTDSPIDDARLRGVFVTVAEVRANGTKVDAVGKQTFDLAAYREGKTKTLGTANLVADASTEPELLLDTQTDADGNSPGCYVLDVDGNKHPLTMDGNAEALLRITGNNTKLATSAGQSTTAVIDFDLRKAVKATTQSANDQYDFVAQSELAQALRVVVQSETGTIAGKVNFSGLSADNQVVVYAYRKGTYTAAEAQASGNGQLRFRSAVTSSLTDASGNYKLAFLQNGDYELVLAAYRDTDSDGKTEYQGRVNVNLLGNVGINLSNINVTANSQVTLELSLLGLL